MVIFFVNKNNLNLNSLNQTHRFCGRSYLKRLAEGVSKLDQNMQKFNSELDAAMLKKLDKTKSGIEKALKASEKQADNDETALLNSALDDVDNLIVQSKAKIVQTQPGQHAQVFSDGSDTRHYYLYLPRQYFKSKDPMPLMLFLHGIGEQGVLKHGGDLSIVKKGGPPSFLDGKSNFPFIVVSPQNPKQVGWWRAPVLKKLLDDVISKYNVDEDRVYCTGLSMGGMGTYTQAAHEPGRFAAILPIAAKASPQQASTIASNKIPVWAFHGDQDTVVHFKEGKRTAEQIKEEGGIIEFTVYPGVKHNSWTQTYNNDKIYDWLLTHRLSDRTK